MKIDKDYLDKPYKEKNIYIAKRQRQHLLEEYVLTKMILENVGKRLKDIDSLDKYLIEGGINEHSKML